MKSKFFIPVLFLVGLLISRAQAAIIYVDAAVSGGNGTSWAAAYSGLDTALTNARTGDVIWIKAGTYKPTTGTDRTISFQLKNGVHLFGGFAGNETTTSARDLTNVQMRTILSGDIGTVNSNTDNSYHVLQGANAVLDGLTITEGNANVTSSSSAVNDGDGGGLVCNGAFMVLRHCNFTSNSAYDDGGAIYVNNGSLNLENCTFTSNSTQNISGSAGGAIYSGVAIFDAAINGRNLHFESNAAYQGGAIYAQSSVNCNIERSVFLNNSSYNSGGALYANDSSSLFKIRSSLFLNNSAGANATGSGGAIYCNAGTANLVHVTMGGGTASTKGQEIYNYSGTVTVLNSIIWDARSSVLRVENESSTVSTIFSHSNIKGSGGSAAWTSAYGMDVGNNIDADPAYTSINNFRGADQSFGTGDDGLILQSASPCKDTGLLLSQSADNLDMLGRSRPVGAGVDMGAYEGAAGNDISVTFSGTPEALGLETAGAVSIGLQLSAASGSDITAAIVAEGEAKLGLDFTLSANVVTFAAGTTSQTVTMTILNDTLYESDELLSLRVSTSAGAVPGRSSRYLYKILDNDGPTTPVVSLGATALSQYENVTSFTLPVYLSSANSTSATVSYTVSGTATGDGVDHNMSAGSIVFLPGETAKTLTISTVNDTGIESDETLVVTLTGIAGPTGASVGSASTFTYTIKDNDVLPEVYFERKTSEGTEGNNFTHNVLLSHPSDQPVVVHYTTSASTATFNVDYSTSSSPSPLVFGASSTAQYIYMQTSGTYDDTIAESDESITFVLRSAGNATLKSGCTTHTQTIVDDDATPSVSFFNSLSSRAETASSGTISIGLFNDKGLSTTSDKPVVVTLGTGSGTASAGALADYLFTTTSLTIHAGSSSASFSYSIIDNAVNEATETVVFNITSAGNATLGSLTTHTASIIDNDSTLPYTVNFYQFNGTGISEAGGTMSFRGLISPVANKMYTVDYIVAGGNATQDIDYTTSSSVRTISFSTGSSVSTFATINIVQDTALETPGESILLALGNPTGGAVIGSANTYNLSILDDDAPAVAPATPSVFFNSAAQNAYEYSGSVSFTVRISNSFNQDVLVPYTIVSGNASGNAINLEDFVMTSGNVVFSANTTFSRSFSVPLVQDAVPEGREVFTIRLGTPTNATLGFIPESTVTILDDDSPPVVSLSHNSSPMSIHEHHSSDQWITVSFDDGLPRGFDVLLNYTLSGGTAVLGVDYTTGGGTLTIPAGSTFTWVPLRIINDLMPESNKTMTLALTGAHNARLGVRTTQGIVIIDNDAIPLVQFQKAMDSSNESTSYYIYIGLSTPVGWDVYVNYAVGTGSTAVPCGEDLKLLDSGRVKIGAGGAGEYLYFDVIDDKVKESNETVFLTLSSPLNAALGTNSNFAYTIIDNDGNPNLEFDKPLVYVREQATSFNVKVNLSEAITNTVTVRYNIAGGSATENIDYSTPISTDFSGTLEFSSGQTSQFINLSIIDDDRIEAMENFTITLSNPSNANLTGQRIATVNIVDDDADAVGQTDNIASLARVNTFGGISSDTASSIIEDSTGSLLVGGSFSGNADMDPGDPVAQHDAPNQGLYLSRFNGNGEFQQAVSMASSSSASLARLATDGNDVIHMAGSVTGALSQGAATIVQSSPASNENAILLKLNTAGAVQSSVVFHGGPNSIVDMQVAPGSKAVYMLGRFSGTVDFDPGSGVTTKSSQGSVSSPSFEFEEGGFNENLFKTGARQATSSNASDLYVVKLNANGSLSWVKTFGASGVSFNPAGLALDAQENVYFIGSFRGTDVDFNPSDSQVAAKSSQSPSYTDIFLEKLNANGDFAWVQVFGSAAFTSEESGHGFASVAVNADNEVLVTYQIADITDVDPGTVADNRQITGVMSDSRDTILGKYRPDGSLVWAKSLNNAGHQHVQSITTDSFGLVYIAGEVHGAVDVDPDSGVDIRIHKGSYNRPFISRYDRSGQHQYTKTFGNNNYGELTDLCLTKNRQLLAVGEFSGNVDFDPGPAVALKSSAGQESADAFMLMFNQRAESNEPLTLGLAPVVSVGGRAKFYVKGGTAPFVVSITPADMVQTDGLTLIGLREGVFSATVTDAIGASISTTGQVLAAQNTTHRYVFGEYRSATDFRMVTFPFHHEGRSGAFVRDRLRGLLGEMSPDTFMIYGFTGRSADGYEDLSSAAVQAEPGRGFWMATLAPQSFEVNAPAPRRNEIVEVALRQGWNMIGNPYSTTVSVREIHVSTGPSGGVISVDEGNITGRNFWTWNPASNSYDSASRLAPGQAAWVLCFNPAGARLFFLDNGLTKAGMDETRLSAADEEPRPPAPPSFTGGMAASAGGGGCLIGQ